VARQSTRTSLQVGHAVGVVIDADAAHLFDAQGRVTRSGASASVAEAA
jgi:multiple sugar transport system ATP-binding protein